MGFRYDPTDDPNSSSLQSRIHLLEQLLIQHSEAGVEIIELRRQMGKSGYLPTRHRWVNDGDGDDLSDEEGRILLMGGVAPGDLAAEIIDTARRHIEETGELKNYRVVACLSTTSELDGEPEKIFQFGLPASLFGAAEDLGQIDASRDQHDALLAMTQQYSRDHETLFRMLMDVVRQYPAILAKSSSVMQQLGDQLEGERQTDFQQVLALLDFETKREERWMQHDRNKQRSDHRAELLAKSLEVAGPDLMQVLREAFERMTREATVDTTATETDPTTPPGSELASTLDAVLSSVAEDGLTKARELLTDDEWRVLESARKSSSDEEFLALFQSLRALFLRRGKDGVKELERDLLGALGPEAALALYRLLRMVQER